MPRNATIGIDVGGTKLLFVLFDDTFKPIEEIKIRTPKEKKSEFTEAIVEFVKKLGQSAAKQDLEVTAVGVGCSGKVDPETGFVHNSPNIPALHNFSFEKTL